MERPSDAPFFVGQTPEQRRQQFRLIHGSGGGFDERSHELSRMANHFFLVNKQTVVREFLDELGLDFENFDNSNVDPLSLPNLYEHFKEDKILAIGQEEADTIPAFDEFVAIAQASYLSYKDEIRLMPLGASRKKKVAILKAVRQWNKITRILHEAVLHPGRKLELVTVQENPAERSAYSEEYEDIPS